MPAPHPDFPAWSGDEPDPFDHEAVEQETYAQRAREAAFIESFLTRTGRELARALRAPGNNSSFDQRQAIRAALVETWNQSRRVAAHHDALMVERPTTT